MSERIAAVVLAGGLGTRLRAVLPDLPKPMAPVAGRPFVEWVIRYLAAQGVREVIISTGYRAEVFARHFADHTIPGMDAIRYVVEPAPMGTAGGFLFAAGTSTTRPDAWLVLNGDSLVLADLAPLFATLHEPANDGGLLALRMKDAARYGSIDIGEGDALAGFREKRPGASWINAGIYLVRDSLLARFPEKRPLSWETDVFPELLARGHLIAVTRTHANFIDIGLPETLAQASHFIRKHGSAFA